MYLIIYFRIESCYFDLYRSNEKTMSCSVLKNKELNDNILTLNKLKDYVHCLYLYPKEFYILYISTRNLYKRLHHFAGSF